MDHTDSLGLDPATEPAAAALDQRADPSGPISPSRLTLDQLERWRARDGWTLIEGVLIAYGLEPDPLRFPDRLVHQEWLRLPNGPARLLREALRQVLTDGSQLTILPRGGLPENSLGYDPEALYFPDSETGEFPAAHHEQRAIRAVWRFSPDQFLRWAAPRVNPAPAWMRAARGRPERAELNARAREHELRVAVTLLAEQSGEYKARAAAKLARDVLAYWDRVPPGGNAPRPSPPASFESLASRLSPLLRGLPAPGGGSES